MQGTYKLGSGIIPEPLFRLSCSTTLMPFVRWEEALTYPQQRHAVMESAMSTKKSAIAIISYESV